MRSMTLCPRPELALKPSIGPSPLEAQSGAAPQTPTGVSFRDCLPSALCSRRNPASVQSAQHQNHAVSATASPHAIHRRRSPPLPLPVFLPSFLPSFRRSNLADSSSSRESDRVGSKRSSEEDRIWSWTASPSPATAPTLFSLSHPGHGE